MRPDEARDALVDVMTDTAGRLDAEGWADDGEPLAQECGASGVKFGYGYGSGDPGPEPDREADATTVSEYWASLGISVETKTAGTTGAPVVFGTGGPVQSISFDTSAGLYSISGTSLCADGNADDYR